MLKLKEVSRVEDINLDGITITDSVLNSVSGYKSIRMRDKFDNIVEIALGEYGSRIEIRKNVKE